MVPAGDATSFASDDLPSGLSIDASTGVISDIPALHWLLENREREFFLVRLLSSKRNVSKPKTKKCKITASHNGKGTVLATWSVALRAAAPGALGYSTVYFRCMLAGVPMETPRSTK